MSQHHKKDKDTRQRKNVDKENSNSNSSSNKQQTKISNTTSPGQNTSSTSPSSSTAKASATNSVEKPNRKTNNGALSIMNVKQQQQMKPLNKQQKEKLKAEREALVLWRQPIKTLSYCSLEIVELVKTLVGK